MELLRLLLCEHYGLQAHTIVQTQGGWSADAYVAKTDTADYFVKLYDKRRPSVRPWIARMDDYMPAVLWLHKNTPLRGRMTAPLYTMAGEYRVETPAHVLLLFPMLQGRALGDVPMNGEQVRQAAEILACLHSYGSEAPVCTRGIREDYELPFLSGLTALMEAGDAPAELRGALLAHQSVINKATEVLRGLAAYLQHSSPDLVLCHTDLHGGNLMWTGRLVLIDWEGLRLAPAEADLFAFTGGFFFDHAGEAFLSAYRCIRKDYRENAAAAQFYRLCRRVEDIAEYAEAIAGDGLSPQALASYLRSLRQECAALSAML